MQTMRMDVRQLWHLALLLLLLSWRISTANAAPGPRVAVVACPIAEAWLNASGIDFLRLEVSDLTRGIGPEIQLLILPLDRVQSAEGLRGVAALTARGGKVIAVYWGNIARYDRQTEFPLYQAASGLGFRVAGWSYMASGIVKPEPAVPAGPVSDLKLNHLTLMKVEPEPTAQLLARVTPAAGGDSMALLLRNGNYFYSAANLFHRGSDDAGVKKLFFWLLDQAWPGLAFAQARKKAGAAMAAAIRARERLSVSTRPDLEEARRLLDEAARAAERARALAAGQQFGESAAASNLSHQLTERALRLLQKQ